MPRGCRLATYPEIQRRRLADMRFDERSQPRASHSLLGLDELRLMRGAISRRRAAYKMSSVLATFIVMPSISHASR